jgi:predicted outer membrane protein
MKQLFLFFVAAILSVASYAQQAEWKQMEEFHSVMSKTFHPAEEGNLKPTKDNAATLTAKAKAWESAPIPKGYDAAIAKPILKKLVTSCEAIEAGVKAKKSDKELTALITKAHDNFHEIKEKCVVGEKH